MAVAAPKDAVLEEEIDESYEPTEEELVDYATWLGIDLPNHRELLWIAKKALKEPLPDHWKPCLTKEDEIYYYNFATGESIWDHPCDEHYRNLYKEEVEKLQDCGQPFSGQNLESASQGNEQRNGEEIGSSSAFRATNRIQGKTSLTSQQSSKEKSAAASRPSSNLLELVKPGYLAFSTNSMRNVIQKGFATDKKSFSVSCFPIEQSFARGSKLKTRSLPMPQISRLESESLATGPYRRAYMSADNISYNLSMVTTAASAQSTANERILSTDNPRVQEMVSTSQPWQRNELSPTGSGTAAEEAARKLKLARKDVDPWLRSWVQEEEKKLIEERRQQMRDEIQERLDEEERIVLQQERIEMLERVGESVQQEEQQILGTLRKEIIEKVEKQVQEEFETLLRRRRRETHEEIERQIQAERHLRASQNIQGKERRINIDDSNTKPSEKVSRRFYSQEEAKRQENPKRQKLKKILEEERKDFEYFESEMHIRLQELREKLQEQQLKLMEDEKKEMIKRVKEEVQEEEFILYEKMKLDMMSRVGKKMKALETSAFEKEYQLLVDRIRETVSLKNEDLQEKIENELEVQLSLQHKESLFTQQNDRMFGMPGETDEDEERVLDKKSKAILMENRQKQLQELKAAELVEIPIPSMEHIENKRIKSMSHLLIGETSESMCQRRLNVHGNDNTSIMMRKGTSEETLISRLVHPDMEEDAKKKVRMFISDFEESCLRQKIRQEVVELVKAGLLVGNIADHQGALHMDLNKAQQDAAKTRSSLIGDESKTTLFGMKGSHNSKE